MAMPFFAVGDRIARAQAASGQVIALDGTSYPYGSRCASRDSCGAWSACISALSLARRVATAGGAAAAVALVALGSFVLWYLVRSRR